MQIEISETDIIVFTNKDINYMSEQKNILEPYFSELEVLHPELFTPEQQDFINDKLADTDSEIVSSRFEIAKLLLSEIGLGRSAVASILLVITAKDDTYSEKQIEQVFDASVVSIIRGLNRVAELYQRNTALETENFRKLLLTIAEDVRVVLIMLAERLYIMRNLQSESDAQKRKSIAEETSFLYAPLAHRLGLYVVKTELEDLSLKFTHYDIYKDIAHKLNETKRQRDAYINAFIGPLQEKLEQQGFKFHIKGRTKSIHSIYNKMLKQNTTVDHIYDLFAIRIILDSEPEREKAECWQVYSIIADMYQPNPKRLRDWLTIPKSNGYESLHTTVLGPDNKWVEVQIRTERMDEVAEKGVAAHWRYKGIKSESGMDDFLKNIREILENPDANAAEVMSDFQLNLYDQEVFVFTPSGDLHQLRKGATALDFAFSIHSGLGCRCVGARVNGKNVPIKYVLQNGDQVEVLTSNTQHPTPAWLNIVVTSKAKSKIRQALKEQEHKNANEGKETLERRFKNWKLDLDDGKISKLSQKSGYKTVTDFYQAIALGHEDPLAIRDKYIELDEQGQRNHDTDIRSAGEYIQSENTESSQDVLVIDKNLKNVDFKLAKCCNPIYGDRVFGFVSITNGIKIHREDCPNAREMRERYPYRIVPARWSGKAIGSQYPITLEIVGHDDIGIVSNISSLINKEQGVLLRTISIDSHDGLFDGHLTLMVSDLHQLDSVIKKIRTVKGVKSVTRQ